MCGIAGFISLEPHSFADSVLLNMTRSIAHRGPDDTGVYRDAQAALGHRRLSIVDLAAGHQPMTSESGDLWIIFNGEIFNHAAIRAEKLEPRGLFVDVKCHADAAALREHGLSVWRL